MNKIKDNFINYFNRSFNKVLENKYFRKAPFLVAMLLLVIILFQLINISWTILLPNQTLLNQSQIETRASDKNQYIELSGDPMERNSSQALLEALKEKIPPKTSLPLKLYGVTYSNTGVTNFAILGFKLGEQKRYKEDDLIAKSILLERIEYDYVVINRDGVREIVSFSEDSSLSGIKKKTVKSFSKPTKMNALSSLSEVMSLKPYFNNGKLEGYEISSGQEEGVFNNSGLKEGDILLAVNGLNFSDPSLVKEISSSDVRLDLLRDRKALSLIVGLN